MKLSILIIGDEILIGQVTDTNSGEIARRLGPLGWEIAETRVVGDNAADISRAVVELLGHSDLVISTGGLGPTKDDITKKVLTDYFGGTLRRDASVTDNIERVFARRSLTLNQLTLDQALVPTSCRVIQNELGTAPIMWFDHAGKVFIAMPGVPYETVGMLDRSVVREIMARFSPDTDIRHHSVIVTGVTESYLAGHLALWESSLPAGAHLAYLPNYGYIRLRLDGKDLDSGVYDTLVAQLRENVADWLVADGDLTPARIVLGKLRARGLTMATAESCTGGNIAHTITQIPGSSDSYVGSVVSYANSVKTGVLKVPPGVLEAEGAVSQPVVTAMAEGAASILGADCSVATSGVAGPGGGTPDKPVGTVWIAAHVPGHTESRLFHFDGDRDRVILRASAEALMMLARLL